MSDLRGVHEVADRLCRELDVVVIELWDRSVHECPLCEEIRVCWSHPLRGGLLARHPVTELHVIVEGRHMKEVYEVSDDELLRRAVNSALCPDKNKGVPHPRWVAVKGCFWVGSTYAHLLCQRFGLDPDEMVKR